MEVQKMKKEEAKKEVAESETVNNPVTKEAKA